MLHIVETLVVALRAERFRFEDFEKLGEVGLVLGGEEEGWGVGLFRITGYKLRWVDERRSSVPAISTRGRHGDLGAPAETDDADRLDARCSEMCLDLV